MKKNKIYPWWFLVIPLLFYICFFLSPSLLGVGYSFTDWSSRSAIDGTHFVGLKNYIEIFTSDTDYASGILHTLMFTVVSNIVKLIPALLLAVMLQEGLRGKGIYRTILYLPSILPFVIIGIVFKSIFNFDHGLLNTVLEALNLEFLQQKWLSDLDVVWKSIFGVDAWRGIGYCMTIFLAGLQTIPKSLYEAAKIDGAGKFRTFTDVVFPLILPIGGVIAVLCVIGSLKVFDIVQTMTNGGPYFATDVVATFVYRTAYSSTTGSPRLGYASAAALLFGLMVVTIGVVLNLVKNYFNKKRNV